MKKIDKLFEESFKNDYYDAYAENYKGQKINPEKLKELLRVIISKISILEKRGKQ